MVKTSRKLSRVHPKAELAPCIHCGGGKRAPPISLAFLTTACASVRSNSYTYCSLPFFLSAVAAVAMGFPCRWVFTPCLCGEKITACANGWEAKEAGRTAAAAKELRCARTYVTYTYNYARRTKRAAKYEMNFSAPNIIAMAKEQRVVLTRAARVKGKKEKL